MILFSLISTSSTTHQSPKAITAAVFVVITYKYYRNIEICTPLLSSLFKPALNLFFFIFICGHFPLPTVSLPCIYLIITNCDNKHMPINPYLFSQLHFSRVHFFKSFVYAPFPTPSSVKATSRAVFLTFTNSYSSETHTGTSLFSTRSQGQLFAFQARNVTTDTYIVMHSWGVTLCSSYSTLA